MYHQEERHIYDALDNFETLRRHVAVVHSKSEACKWGECARGDVEVQLPTAMDFERHLEEMHLTPLVWHVGDGPKNGTHVPATRGNGEPLPAYLFDADGVQITPSIRGQRYESAEECAERQRNMRRLQRLQAENAPEEEELTEAEMAQINANQDARHSEKVSRT
ncbi:hypothetical protein P8C59_006215 [Phyllachora maydis]|uniref:Uncharacterized protein n=1 Tax=Phyllachora maydis TaxID=1825666 RepID=A0AAD9MEB6_9PEZI|nr:hypothetical protein P8C59_006215 [Phyllachora maydis]